MSTASQIIEKIMKDPAGLSLLVVHAHPDDETLATGPLIAGLADSGAHIDVLMCTRGERGEVVPGVLPAGLTPAQLIVQRERELETACDLLGVRKQYFLGASPFRAPAHQGRHYEDSGMEWVTPTLAGPAADASENSLTSSSKNEEIHDLLNGLHQGTGFGGANHNWSAVISYDDGGGYGHPDHVRAHLIAAAAAKKAGLPFVQIVSNDDAITTTDSSTASWYSRDDVRTRDVVIEALRAYRTQLSVLGTASDGTESAEATDDLHIRHVGGQRQEIPQRIGLIPG
jgi:N-acetyl-1-D-myo-inositol-2-amino-2-deoxy-alpha-D-glucopyranoside deacetylase